MAQRIFLVDTEASGPTPFSGVMTEFGVVDYTTRAWFHGRLWPFAPHPDTPALPVVAADAVPEPGWTIGTDPDVPADQATVTAISDVFLALRDWLESFGDRPVMMSDNPGFDFMWVADGFDRTGMPNPFGHSSRRIGDLAAGLSGNWRNTSGWKKHRRTVHDHNPVNDAMGNAEALSTMLERYQQRS